MIVEMTGFEVNDNTSFGVGNVMEFYINFGMSSLIVGFLFLGLLFGWLDRQAAVAQRNGNLGQSILYFLPAAIIIQPNANLAEIVGGGVCAFLAALGWRWLWNIWSASKGAVQKPRRRLRRQNSNDHKPGGEIPATDAMPRVDRVVGRSADTGA